MPKRLIQILFSLLLIISTNGCSFIGYGSRDSIIGKPIYYRVKKGDSLFAISKKFNVSENKIALLNGLRDPKDLGLGQILLLGYSSSVLMAKSAAQKGAIIGPASEAEPKSLFDEYEIYTDGKLKWPIDGSGRLVSGFGPRNGSFHDGIDIATFIGTPVFAAHDGTVIYSGNKLRGYGNLIIIRDSTTTTLTVYAHNRRLLVERGARVHRGQKIAEVGLTGNTSGPHLHFEVRVKNKKGQHIAVDPLVFFMHSKAKKIHYRVNEKLTALLFGNPP